jgi:NADH dehydrogenase
MATTELHVVTGAFSYTGKYIAERFLAQGKRVRTLTGHPDRPNPFGDKVSAHPFNFDKPAELTRSLEGAAALFNTYWVRFPYGNMTYDQAVKNTKTLIRAAEKAGVRRMVHVSIAHASEDSPFPYYKGKGELERAIVGSGLSYAILRPTVLFGHEGILINNIAWLLRRFPVFAVPGPGEYCLRPVHVEDLAGLAVKLALSDENTIMDAVGPETYTFNGLVRLIGNTVKSRARIVHLPPYPAFYMTKIIGYMIKDVLLTRDEIGGLLADLLVTEGPPTGKTLLSEWLGENAGTVGKNYASELDRHYR